MEEDNLNSVNEELLKNYFLTSQTSDIAPIESDDFNRSYFLTVSETNPYYFYVTEQLTFLWIFFTVIVLGNCAVILSLTLPKTKKSRMNYFIMHLALADLSVGIINVLTDIVWKITVSWHAGNCGCKIVRFLQVLVTYSSTYVLVALSIDRYDAIKHPMNFSKSRRRAKWLIMLAWMMSVVFSIPILFLYEERIINNQPQCWIDFPKSDSRYWQLYMSLVAIVLFIIPTFIITTCYAIIVYTIWSKGKPLGSLAQPKNERRKKGFAKRRGDMDCRRASSRGLIPKAKIKTVKMTLAIIFVFIICWCPYIIYDLLQVYGYIPTSQTNVAVSTFIQSLAPLNSAANPIIYCLFNTRLPRHFKQIFSMRNLTKKSCCHSTTLQSEVNKENRSENQPKRIYKESKILQQTIEKSNYDGFAIPAMNDDFYIPITQV